MQKEMQFKRLESGYFLGVNQKGIHSFSDQEQNELQKAYFVSQLKERTRLCLKVCPLMMECLDYYDAFSNEWLGRVTFSMYPVLNLFPCLIEKTIFLNQTEEGVELCCADSCNGQYLNLVGQSIYGMDVLDTFEQFAFQLNCEKLGRRKVD